MPQILRYRSKISGPLMDRIDIHVEVPAVKYQDLTGETSGEPGRAFKEIRAFLVQGKSVGKRGKNRQTPEALNLIELAPPLGGPCIHNPR